MGTLDDKIEFIQKLIKDALFNAAYSERDAIMRSCAYDDSVYRYWKYMYAKVPVLTLANRIRLALGLELEPKEYLYDR